VSGRGVIGICNGHEVFGGNLAFMQENAVSVDTEDAETLSREGKTALYFALDGKLIGIIAVADTVKEESIEAIKGLKRKGIRTLMLTGDNRLTALAVQRIAGTDEVMAEVMPSDKEAVIKRLQAEGKRVAMVGDGINDAPALCSSNVGIAVGAGTDIAIDSADIVLMKSSLLDVLSAIELSRKVIANIRMNLFWAFFYNSLGIPLAAGLLYIPFGIRLNPMIGAAAMSLSSVCVVTNALRLYRFKNKYTKIIDIPKGEEKMEKVLNVEGMMCMHCKAHVEKALAAVSGVTEVKVDLDAGTATVKLETEVADDVLSAAITDAGYEVKKIK